MKLVTAVVRWTVADKVAAALETASVRAVAVSAVRGVGWGYEPEHYAFGPRDVGHAPEFARVEFLCAAAEADRLVPVVAEVARSGLPGDGIVFVTAVERLVRVRTGQEGAGVLADLGCR